MSTTIETAGGSIGIAAGNDERPVLLSLFLSGGSGISLRLTADEARHVAAEMLARLPKEKTDDI